MISIIRKLAEDELNKAEAFLKRIKPLLATNECQFQISEKNKEFDSLYGLRDAQKIGIIKSLSVEDCIEIAPNNNSKYSEAEVYVFIKCVDLEYYGEAEPKSLYIKMYVAEGKNFDVVIVISLHEEGKYDD